MKHILGMLIIVVTLSFSNAVQAACTTQTIFLPDGSTMVCTTCCYQNYLGVPDCTTTCL